MTTSSPVQDQPTSGLRDFVASCAGGLVMIAPAIPVAALVLTAGLFLAYGNDWLRTFIPAGGGALVLSLVGTALAGRLASFENANVGSSGELQGRLAQLQVRRKEQSGSDKQEGSLADVDAQIDVIQSEWRKPGLRWVLGTGYITLWQTLHRAEEAQLSVETDEFVIAAARYDQLRLQGSKIPNADDMRKNLDQAIAALSVPEPSQRQEAEHLPPGTYKEEDWAMMPSGKYILRGGYYTRVEEEKPEDEGLEFLET